MNSSYDGPGVRAPWLRGYCYAANSGATEGSAVANDARLPREAASDGSRFIYVDGDRPGVGRSHLDLAALRGLTDLDAELSEEASS